MKKTFLLTLAIVLSASAFSQSLVNVLTDGSVCGLSYIEQQRSAIRTLLENAEKECGPQMVPVQITETVLEEGHSCLHYRLGVYAEAYFKCVVLTPSP